MNLSFLLRQTSGHVIISTCIPINQVPGGWNFGSVRLSKKSSMFCTSETLIEPLAGVYQGDLLIAFLSSAICNDLNAHILS